MACAAAYIIQQHKHGWINPEPSTLAKTSDQCKHMLTMSTRCFWSVHKWAKMLRLRSSFRLQIIARQGKHLTNICVFLVWQHADLQACLLLRRWQRAVEKASTVPASSDQQSQDLGINCIRTLQSVFRTAVAKLLMW